MESSVFISILLAIALGGLIGTEREMPWTGARLGGANGFGGIRTYASISFFGAIAMWLDIKEDTLFWAPFGGIISAIFIIVSYAYSSFERDKMGATSEYAALITYFIGVIAMMGQYTSAAMLAILLLLLLSAKEYFTKLKSRFSRKELGDTLKFSVIALVILPLLPDTKYSLLDMGNWLMSGGLDWTHQLLVAKFFNPHSVWFFVVVMTGVEYAGFLLGKGIGDKGGIIASGMVGGLISSTATTVAMTRKSLEHPEHRNSYATATLIASCIMFLRVMIVAIYIYPKILDTILVPGGIMFFSLLGITLWYIFEAWKEKVIVRSEKKEEYESPFQIVPALQFAGLIVVIKFIAILGKVYQNVVPQSISNYFLGLISGFADVDAVNFAMTEGAKEGSIPLMIAATTILIAVMSNNTIKASIAYRFGEKEYGRKVVVGFGASIIMGIVTIIILSISG